MYLIPWNVVLSVKSMRPFLLPDFGGGGMSASGWPNVLLFPFFMSASSVECDISMTVFVFIWTLRFDVLIMVVFQNH